MLRPDDIRAQLSQLLQTFQASPSTDDRIAVANQVGRAFANAALTNYERMLACSICEICAADLEVKVRSALAQQLCASPLLPKAMAMRLAMDIDEISCPVLFYSEVLTDDDLLAVMENASQNKLLAISRRETVSAEVAHELVERGNAKVVQSVLANPNSELLEHSLSRVLERYPDEASVLEAVVDRPILPASIAHKLVTMISGVLLQRLVERRDLDPRLVRGIARGTEEEVFVGLGQRQTENLVDALHAAGKLTPMLLLRAIARHERQFFTCGVARLAGLPSHAVEAVLFGGDAHSRSELYWRAGFPSPLFSAFNAVLSVQRDVDETGSKPDPAIFEKAIVFRLAQAFPTVSPTSLDEALVQIEKAIPQ